LLYIGFSFNLYWRTTIADKAMAVFLWRVYSAAETTNGRQRWFLW
jgi:hypothetical protein